MRKMRKREREQEPTEPVAVEKIMSAPEFALGVSDYRAGRPPRESTRWNGNQSWNYERGRAWAAVAPRSVQLKINGRLNRAALVWKDAIL